MKNIVLIASVGLGHIRPMIAMANALINRGVKVYFYAPSMYRYMVQETGAEFRVIILFEKRYMKKLLIGSTYENHIRKEGLDGVHNYVNSMLRINALYTSTLYEEIKSLKPLCIVYDHILYFSKQLAYKIGVPDIAISSAYFYNPSWLHSHTAYALEKNFFLPKHERIHLDEAKSKILEISEKCGKESGICPFDIYYFSNCMWSVSDMQIVFYPREFQLYHDTAEDYIHFCGSYTQIENKEKVSQFYEDYRFTNEDKIIYVSLGTNENYNNNPEFFSKIIRAFATTSYKVVISLGNKVDKNDLPNIPDNIRVSSFIDQLAALQTASLYITHGGMAGVREALYFNVPMVVLPVTFDQFNVSDAVDNYGNGTKLDLASTTEKSIKETVYSVLNNASYINQATKLMHKSRSSGGKDYAADTILRSIRP